MPHPLKIDGRRSELDGLNLRRRLEHGAATVEVIGEVPDDRPHVNICNARNEVVASIGATQMNGLVRRWMKANGWTFTRTETESSYKRPRKKKARGT